MSSKRETLKMPDTFTYEKRGKVAVMTINRPDALNAFTAEMLRAMQVMAEGYTAMVSGVLLGMSDAMPAGKTSPPSPVARSAGASLASR